MRVSPSLFFCAAAISLTVTCERSPVELQSSHRSLCAENKERETVENHGLNPLISPISLISLISRFLDDIQEQALAEFELALTNL
jgi:hypothetical protein